MLGFERGNGVRGMGEAHPFMKVFVILIIYFSTNYYTYRMVATIWGGASPPCSTRTTPPWFRHRASCSSPFQCREPLLLPHSTPLRLQEKGRPLCLSRSSPFRYARRRETPPFPSILTQEEVWPHSPSFITTLDARRRADPSSPFIHLPLETRRRGNPLFQRRGGAVPLLVCFLFNTTAGRAVSPRLFSFQHNNEEGLSPSLCFSSQRNSKEGLSPSLSISFSAQRQGGLSPSCLFSFQRNSEEGCPLFVCFLFNATMKRGCSPPCAFLFSAMHTSSATGNVSGGGFFFFI